ncbi:MAG TPA: hypothetical protein VN213_01090 [Solirubrobacteraceae bacterium]|nr:hypothetical protein [Solirubrobacteraceae bacterium]
MRSRSETLAANQALFRAINERVAAFPENREAPEAEPLMFYCECGDADCFERVRLTRAEYEAIREDAAHFAVIPGHVFPGAEHVVEAFERYTVVEMDEAREIVERSDPRRGPDS